MAPRRFDPELLLAVMQEQKISNRELGKRVRPESPEGGRTALIDHLAGRKTPRLKKIQQYADALGVTVEELTVPDPLALRIQKLRERHDARRAA